MFTKHFIISENITDFNDNNIYDSPNNTGYVVTCDAIKTFLWGWNIRDVMLT